MVYSSVFLPVPLFMARPNGSLKWIVYNKIKLQIKVDVLKNIYCVKKEGYQTIVLFYSSSIIDEACLLYEQGQFKFVDNLLESLGGMKLTVFICCCN